MSTKPHEETGSEHEEAATDESTEEQETGSEAGSASTDENAEGEVDFDKELESLQEGQQQGRSPLDKASHSLKKTMENIESMGGDPYKILGIPKPEAGAGDQSVKENEDGTVTVSKEGLAKLVADQVSEQVGEVRTEFGQAEIDSRVSKLAKSEAEGKVIKFHLENSIRPSGNLDTDIQNAYLLANKGRIKSTFEEVTRGAEAKGSTTDGQGAGASDTETSDNEPPSSVPKADREFAAKRGLVWDKTANDGRGGFVSPRRQEFQTKHAQRNTSGRRSRTRRRA